MIELQIAVLTVQALLLWRLYAVARQQKTIIQNQRKIMSDLDNTNELLDTEAQNEQALFAAITTGIALIQSESEQISALQAQVAILANSSLVSPAQFGALNAKITQSIANIQTQTSALNAAFATLAAPPATTPAPAEPATTTAPTEPAPTSSAPPATVLPVPDGTVTTETPAASTTTIPVPDGTVTGSTENPPAETPTPSA